LAGLGAVAGIASVLVLILHQACYYRHGTIKWPLKGGLWFVLVSIPFVGVTAFKLEQVMPQMTAGAAGLALGLVILIVGALYTGLGIISAMVGEQARVRKGEQLHDTLTRQQLLERLFTAQARLSEVTQEEDGLKRRKSLRERARTSPVFPLYGAVVGLAFGLAKVLVISGLIALFGASQPVARGLEIIFGLMGVSAVFILGYYTGSIMRALTAVLSAYGAALLTYLLPVGDFGLIYVQDLIANRDQIQQLYLMLFIAAVSGWGGMVESKGMQQKRLRADDPAALLAEIVTLQRRLSPKSKSACVLVVDAARSTILKAGANPLDIEYTFREYQHLVRRISSKWGGEVLSTAGDGAVVGFSSPSDAVSAGKVIQTEMAHFNAHTNRLSSALRLRIGVHCGETATDLQAAPYNSLIDIAAHVEETAPVGGIAVTETVALHLEDEKMAEIKDKVHDLTVLFLLAPTTTS
jgi:class 3 adenylate cyclase